MKTPPHPGLSVRLNCLEPQNLSVTAAAKILGVTRQALNNVVNGSAGVSPEMAIKLEKTYGSRAEIWLGMQVAYDLAQARLREGKVIVKPVACAKETSRPNQHDREVLAIEDFSDADIDAIRNAEPSITADSFSRELEP